MEKKTLKYRTIVILVLVAALGAAILWGMAYCYNTVPVFRQLFAAPGSDVYGNVAEESAESIANKSEFTAKVSMWIFAFITVLQVAAMGIGYAVISAIRLGEEEPSFRLKNLENAEVFFDIPLYFGLFGTVSAFLVMTFSPQSSRLIAYSSTLIGIVFSLLLRITMQYPLRRKLMREQYESEKAAAARTSAGDKK